jgi:hypothetical protein
MPGLADHPTVKKFRSNPHTAVISTLSGSELKQLCLDAGADDVGFVSLNRGSTD